jgi:hypothetical protein
LAEERLSLARQVRSGRPRALLCGGHEHALRQTVLALIAGMSWLNTRSSSAIDSPQA